MAAILVGMADLKVARGPDVLTTLGLGSCVGVALYDIQRQISGLAHIMLPWSGDIQGSRMKFADTGIADLVKQMAMMGAGKAGLVAKIAGGAHMFGAISGNSILNVGERNIDACVKILAGMGIPIMARDVGGRHGRTIEVHITNGSLKIKTIGYGESVI